MRQINVINAGTMRMAMTTESMSIMGRRSYVPASSPRTLARFFLSS